jgi:hypothetical protein
MKVETVVKTTMLAGAAALACAPVASAEVTATRYPHVDYRTFAKKWEFAPGKSAVCNLNTILTVQSPTWVIAGAKARCSANTPYPPRLAVSLRRNNETIYNEIRPMKLIFENGALTWGVSHGPEVKIAAARYQTSAVIVDPAGRWELWGNSEVVKSSASVK